MYDMYYSMYLLVAGTCIEAMVCIGYLEEYCMVEVTVVTISTVGILSCNVDACSTVEWLNFCVTRLRLLLPVETQRGYHLMDGIDKR